MTERTQTSPVRKLDGIEIPAPGRWEIDPDHSNVEFVVRHAFTKMRGRFNDFSGQRNKKYAQAIEHLNKAIELDPDYSAAWKAYGKALQLNGNLNDAIKAYKKGIMVADKNGDIQASREMSVFLKRLLNES